MDVTLLLPAAGALIILAVGVDAFRTVLLPVSAGPVNRGLSVGLFRLTGAMPGRIRVRLMGLVGPIVLILTTVVWLTLLWVGFALFYLTSVEALSYSSDARFDNRGVFEALYLSGTALTTLGFGDVVGQSTLLRFTTIVEAAAGIGVLTATLGYLPAIYTLVSELRSSNQAVADLGAEEPTGAAELLAKDGSLVLDEVRRDVIAARQHLQRFPVLHYFQPPYDESVVALSRGAVGLWIAGHFVEDEDPSLHRQLKALEKALRRLTEEIVRHGGAAPGRPDRDRAALLFEQAREVSLHPKTARDSDIDDEDVQLLAELEAVLDAYASAHNLPEARSGD